MRMRMTALLEMPRLETANAALQSERVPSSLSSAVDPSGHVQNGPFQKSTQTLGEVQWNRPSAAQVGRNEQLSTTACLFLIGATYKFVK